MTSTPSSSFQCLVVGAGHTGLLLARLLADQGLNVALLDKKALTPAAQAPSLRPAGWGLSINLGAVTALRTAGLWPYLQQQAQPLQSMTVRDAATAQEVVYQAKEINAEALSWGIAGGALEHGLFQAILEQPDLTLLGEEEIADLTLSPSGAEVLCKSGRRFSADLIVAADGRQSRLRQMAGLDGPKVNFRQTALALGIGHDRSHHGQGFEAFLPGGPLAFLPLPSSEQGKPHSCLTWVLPEKEATAWQSADPKDLQRHLADILPARLGHISLETPLSAFPLSFSHARAYGRDRLVLVGDAAHGLHPIHAQGFNLALRDVARLAELLVQGHRDQKDLGRPSLLRSYQMTRLPDSLTTGLFTTGLNLTASSSNPLALAGRKVAAGLLQNLPPLRQLLTLQGMGQGPGRPRLLRGLPL
ncbi:FAD-dependent monooxygenase [Rhodovibrionaceae bacterium A322]